MLGRLGGGLLRRLIGRVAPWHRCRRAGGAWLDRLRPLQPTTIAQRQRRPPSSIVAVAGVAAPWTPGTYTQCTRHSCGAVAACATMECPATAKAAVRSSWGRTYVLVIDRAVRAEPRVGEAAGRCALEVPTISARASSRGARPATRQRSDWKSRKSQCSWL